ncbi:MAG: phytoene/squalene synthase family protein [Candidatus Omnitrophica bacterium]|nr:phytoene/squalene synthase family protein [Candidatus Omnitrophota bacterium]
MEATKENKISSGYKIAEKITKRYAKNFYFASLFLTKEKRNATYAIYAICRLSDEATDKDSSLIELSTAKRNIESIYNNEPPKISILSAFKETVDKYHIPRFYFDELIEGMYMDFCKNRYRNFPELWDYCYKVAGVVGLMILILFGYDNDEAKDYAVRLGVAMQLTNMLRDLKEDYARGRIYLPQEEMFSFGVSENDIKEGIVNENFRSLMKFQIERARDLYRESELGIIMIADRRCRFVASLMKEIYSGILDEIEKNGYDVFSKRAYVNLWGKISRTIHVLRRIKK